jgi:acyl-CoA reductase-like NAD-dependent aldehyde dehydrogenase
MMSLKTSVPMDALADQELPQELMLIGGEWVKSEGGQCLTIENPATRRVLAQVPRATASDVDHAVQVAARAFIEWRRELPRERGKCLLRIADALEAQSERLARLVASETGNALRLQSRPEVQTTIDIFRYFGGLASELKGETHALGEQVLSYTRREPYGVVGAIVPWNVPLMLSALKIAPALCAGNTLVLKAAEDAPLAVLALARICTEHLPAGVLNVLTGLGEECGAPLAQHPLVQKLSFTGSTEVGKSIMQAASERIVPVSLELGGKSPSIVFPDADDATIVDGVIAAMRFTRQGQACTAGSRLFLHTSIFSSFLEKLVSKLRLLKIGDPLDETTDIGALINQKQFDRVCAYIQDGMQQKEAQLVTGGLPQSNAVTGLDGYFLPPTIFAHAHNEWRISQEEIFGPVLVAIPWTEEEEVIRMANASHYGLAAYIWTHDIARGLRTAHAIEAGFVQINQGKQQTSGQSYGGYKQSGIGREFSLESMLESFTQRKNVTVNLQW